MDTGDDGAHVVVADERTLHDAAVAAYPNLPHFMFGHSWGSMIARGYASAHGADLRGLMLCGVAAQMEGIESVLDRAALAAAAQEHGEEPGADFVAAMFAGMISRFPGAVNGNEWIAADAGVLLDHASDPLNALAQPMSNRFVRDFVDLYDAVNDGWAESISPDLPVLLLAGEQDPVANYGEGALHVAGTLWRNGSRDVRTVVYPGVRHEVHNEPSTRPLVEAEVVGFIAAHL